MFITGVLFSPFSKAQVTANFSGSPLTGCAPLVVSLTDLSTGGPTTYNWNFGNGNTSTTVGSVGAVYAVPGVYSVTLTVSNGGSTSTIVKPNYITVYNKPTANFTLSTDTACIGQTITYTDATIISGGPPITSWGWDFGDGNTITTAVGSTTHAYTTPGNYPVSLIVIDPNGCSTTITHTVTIVPSPIAAFTAAPVFKCTAPLNVIFTNTSTSAGTTTYSWNFGDGGTSTQMNPSHTYTASGTYNVTLIVNQNGCIDTVVVPGNIVIQDITPSFVPTPSVVCSGQPITFANTSFPIATSANWTFGDGGTSTNISPAHTYTAAGTYTVTLSATDAAGCTGNTTGIITVNQTPVAAFVADTMVACSAPFSVNFTDNSIGGVTYNWNFGDGNTSTTQNPSHIYNAPGTYTVTLIVTNAGGTCSDSIVKNSFIIISPPIAGFISAPDSGCVPLTVTFNSTGTSSIDPITTYYWYFGDGNTTTTVVTNTSNTYTATGVYSPWLIVQTANGCTDTFICNNCIKVGIPPLANFSIVNDTVCYGMTVTFNDLSVGAFGWYWLFGDGSTSILQNPTHVYGDTGTYQVMLIAFNNGCADTSLIQNVVILPPKAIINYTLSCTNYFTVQFASTSEGADSLFWNFGDGGMDSSNSVNVTHTYPTRGPFTVTLTAYNYATGCSNSTTANFTIAQPIASFTTSAISGCYAFTPVFTGTSQDANSVFWNFGDLATLGDTSKITNPTYTYNLPGKNIVTLIITDINGCKDTITDTLKTLGPLPYFYANTFTGCRPLPVIFVDSSITDSVLVQWTWNFGDGTIVTTNNDSITHIYTTPGIYTVTMSVKDTNGCIKTIVVNNYITPTFPYPALTIDTFACHGDVLTFDASATNAVGPIYDWDYGDGVLAANGGSITTHSYTADGLYVVSLTVTDINGCDSTIKDTIRILKPTAFFNWSIVTAGCGNMQVAFQDSSQGYVTSWSWDFGNGAMSNLQNPIYTYTQPGIYNITLIVTNLGGCKDTLVQDSIIVVPGPVGTFTFSPVTGCSPLTVYFNASSINAQQFIWDFGDGTVILAGDSVVHTYVNAGIFNPVLILADTLSNGSLCLLPATNLTGAVNVTNIFTVLVSPSVMTIPEDSIATVSASVSGGTFPYIYNWSPVTAINCASCTNITITGTGDTLLYVFTVTDSAGCKGYDSLLVFSNPCLEDKIIPNIFSPNGDGKNDVFYLPGVCRTDDYSLIIYDRWGVVMFSSTLRHENWNGKAPNGEDAKDGTYYFIAKVIKTTYKGYVQLVR